MDFLIIPLLVAQLSMPPPGRPPLGLALGAYSVVSSVDMALTVDCVARGACREVGVLRWANSSPALYGASRAVLDVGVGLGLAHLSKTHPRLAFWTAVALTTLKACVVVRNLRALRGRAP